MATILITHLAPAERREIRFLCDLAEQFELLDHRVVLWATIYDKSFAPYYWPSCWRLKEWPGFFAIPAPSHAPARDSINRTKWRERVEHLAKQEWEEESRDAMVDILVDYSLKALDLLQPDLVLSWNTLCPHSGVVTDLARERGIPVELIERAVFPNTWFIEPGGLVGHSVLTGQPLEELVPDEKFEEYERIGREYLDQTDFLSFNKYKQIQRSPIMERLTQPPWGTRRPRIVFFPPDDGTLGFLPVEGEDRRATLPHYKDSFDAVKELSLAHEGITIFKPHPSFLERDLSFDAERYPNLFVVDYDFRKLMEWSDIVASTGSGLEFVAAAMGKPLLLMANDILAGKAIAYEAQAPQGLPQAIEMARNSVDSNTRQQRFFALTGYMLCEYLVSEQDALAHLRRPQRAVHELDERYMLREKETLTRETFAALRERHIIPKLSHKLAVDTKQQSKKQSFPVSRDREQMHTALKDSDLQAIVLDFDYTLLLNNSTDSFIKSLRPQPLAFFIVACADALVKWVGRYRHFDYNKWRDYFRLMLTTLFMPWGWLAWRLGAARRMKKEGNHELIDAVAASPAPRRIVISYGFRHLIAPLLKTLPFEAELISSRLSPTFDNIRRGGKVAALEPSLDGIAPEHTVFVTDSEDDREVIEYLPKSFLLRWCEYAAKPFAGLYFPLRYCLEGKYPNRRYWMNQLLKEDFLLLVLAYGWVGWQGVGLFLLFLSLMTLYEIGYHENDTRGVRYESNPRISAQAQQGFEDYRIGWRGWVWSSGFGVTGISLLLCGTNAFTLETLASDSLRWLGALVILRIVFWLFNNLKTRRRIFCFPLLHTIKNFAYTALLPLTPLGLLLLGSQVMIQTLTYNIYRHGGDISHFNRQGYRLLLFLLALSTTGWLAGGFAFGWRGGLIVAWLLWRTIERAGGSRFKPLQWALSRSVRLATDMVAALRSGKGRG